MSATQSLLDLERFHLVGAGSDPTVANMFRRFLADLPRSIEEIRGAHDSGDWGAFRQKVHRLRGASLTCCFRMFADRLNEWEEPTAGPADLDFSQLREIALSSSEAMERLLPS